MSAVEYLTRQIEFEVAVVAHIQQNRPEDEDEKVFKNTFEINFQVTKERFKKQGQTAYVLYRKMFSLSFHHAKGCR